MQKKFQKFKRRSGIMRRRQVRTLKKVSRHPYLVPVMTFAALLLITLSGYALLTHSSKPARDTRVVIISHDHQEQTVPTIEPTVGALIAKLHLTLGTGDVVEPAPATRISQDDFRINIYRAVPVKIVDGNQATYTFSAATTPRAIARQSGATIYPEDEVLTDPAQNFLKQGAIGEEVTINRSMPINLNLYGTPETIRTRAKTVGDLIREKGVKLAANDQVLPAPSTPLTADLPVFIARNGTTLESITETIPTPVQSIVDKSLAYGTSAVRQQGSPGKQVVTYQNNLVNGRVVSRSVIQTVVTVAPVTQIEVTGSSLSGIKGDMALAGIAASDYTFVDYIISHESGWCPTKAQGQHTCPSTPTNPNTSGGYGLCQATPGHKMSSAGADWATSPITQLKWCSGYAHSRYGSWAAAYQHWVSNHNW